MNRRSALHALLRAVVVFTVVSVVVYRFPGAFYVLTIPFVNAWSGPLNPYVSDLSMTVQGASLTIRGLIELTMTTPSGSLLEPARATWQHTNRELITVFVVAFSAWSVPRCSMRRRLSAVPFVFLFTVIVCSAMVMIDIEIATLEFIGYEWSRNLPLAATPENIAYFEAIESRFLTFKWIESVMDAGGRLALGVFAGLLAYVLPLPDSSREPADG